MRSTLITGGFGLDDVREKHGAASVVLFVLRANGDLAVPTGGLPTVNEGDTLISLVATKTA